MDRRQSRIYIWAGLIIISLLLFSGCFGSPETSGSPKQSNTPGNNTPGNSTPDNDPAYNTAFASAFPPQTPLVCPGTDAGEKNTSFVKTANTKFVYQGKELRFYGYTFYPVVIGGASSWRKPDFPHYIDQMLDMGAQAGQNLIRPTDFWDKHYHDRQQDDVTIWKNMDYLVCAAAQRGVFVNLDVSAFAWFLISQGDDRYNITEWKAFLHAVGKHYAYQSSIAFYSILGEPAPPTSVEDMNRLVDFYAALTDELHKDDGGHHLITAGGFNHMAEETPETPWWQKIYSLPNNDIAAFKTYSQIDIGIIGQITSFANGISKPSIDEEFGGPQNMGDAVYSGNDYNGISTSRAQFYDDVYTRGEENGVAGFMFWNLGCEINPDGYEVSPATTPGVWQVIQKHAPNKPDLTKHASC